MILSTHFYVAVIQKIELNIIADWKKGTKKLDRFAISSIKYENANRHITYSLSENERS